MEFKELLGSKHWQCKGPNGIQGIIIIIIRAWAPSGAKPKEFLILGPEHQQCEGPILIQGIIIRARAPNGVKALL